MNHIPRYLNIPKKIMDMKEKISFPVLAFLFVIFSSCALIPHSEKVRSPTESHRQGTKSYKELFLFSYHICLDHPRGKGFIFFPNYFY